MGEREPDDQDVKEALRALRAEVDSLKAAKDAPVPPPAPLAGAPKSGEPAKPAAAWNFDEKFVGEKVLQYAGMVVLALWGVLDAALGRPLLIRSHTRA